MKSDLRCTKIWLPLARMEGMPVLDYRSHMWFAYTSLHACRCFCVCDDDGKDILLIQKGTYPLHEHSLVGSDLDLAACHAENLWGTWQGRLVFLCLPHQCFCFQLMCSHLSWHRLLGSGLQNRVK